MIIIPNFIDEKMRLALLTLPKNNNIKFRAETHFKFLSEMLKKLKKINPEIKLDGKGYCRMEEKKRGHPWHIDTGTKNHMLWCKFGSSILLTHPDTFTGGELTFKIDGKEKIFKEEHYCSLIMYESNMEHKVTGNNGGRKVFLAFFE